MHLSKVTHGRVCLQSEERKNERKKKGNAAGAGGGIGVGEFL